MAMEIEQGAGEVMADIIKMFLNKVFEDGKGLFSTVGKSFADEFGYPELAEKLEKMDSIEISSDKEAIKDFQSAMGKHGITYSLEPNPDDPSKSVVTFAVKDKEAMLSAFQDYAASQLERSQNRDKPLDKDEGVRTVSDKSDPKQIKEKAKQEKPRYEEIKGKAKQKMQENQANKEKKVTNKQKDAR